MDAITKQSRCDHDARVRFRRAGSRLQPTFRCHGKSGTVNRMRTASCRQTIVSAILANALLLGTAGCRSTQPSAPLDMNAAMQKMMAAANPGPEHAWLHEDVGSWSGTSKSWASAGGESMSMPAGFTVDTLLGGRFTSCRYAAKSEGMPDFEGFSITGYDLAAREFQTMWIDTYGTTMMTGSGKRSADGRTIEMTFGFFCPVRGRRTTIWQQITRESPTRQSHRMWAEDLASGKKYLMMEASYERDAAEGTR